MDYEIRYKVYGPESEEECLRLIYVFAEGNDEAARKVYDEFKQKAEAVDKSSKYLGIYVVVIGLHRIDQHERTTCII